MSLTVKDHMTLRVEQSRWKYPGAKETLIREVFSESATRYYQRLNVLIDSPVAEAAYPQVVRRLRRRRDAARARRRALPSR